MNTKRCPRCDTTKRLAQFPLNRTRPDGHQGWCRDCHRAYGRAHPPKPLRRRPEPPPPSGRPRTPRPRRQLQGANAEAVIRLLLEETFWPKHVIAHLANCSWRTVHRIAKRHGLLGRPTWNTDHCRLAQTTSTRSRVWYDLLAHYTRHGHLDAEVVARSLFRHMDVRNLDSVYARDRAVTQVKRGTYVDASASPPHQMSEGELLRMAEAMTLHLAIWGCHLPHPDRGPGDFTWLVEHCEAHGYPEARERLMPETLK